MSLDIERQAYFPTLIYLVDIPDGAILSKRLATKIRKLRKNDPEGIYKSNVKGVAAWHSKDGLEKREEFNEISTLVRASAQEVFNNLGYHKDSQPLITNMWANITGRHGFNQVHTHPDSLWSGVYYVQAPKDSGNIFFLDPKLQASVMNIRYDKETPKKEEVRSRIQFEPVIGRLILFPAWLQHGVRPNLSERKGTAGERISISFNLRQKLPR